MRGLAERDEKVGDEDVRNVSREVIEKFSQILSSAESLPHVPEDYPDIETTLYTYLGRLFKKYPEKITALIEDSPTSKSLI